MKALARDQRRIAAVALILSALFLLAAAGTATSESSGRITASDTTPIALRYSTYLGVNSAKGVAVDLDGNIYITGSIGSADLPVTPGSAQASYGGGGSDAYVIKLSPEGDRVVYATYIGGSGYDAGAGIAVDSSGNAYVTGTTGSSDFPTTPGAFQPDAEGPSTVFVTKLDPNGSALVYSTYLGTSGSLLNSHDARGIAVDSEGNAYVTGLASENFPTTPNAFQRTTGGRLDAFVSKLNAAGSELVYSTFLGGPQQDIGQAIAVDSSGNAYVTGGTGRGFPTTPGAFRTSISGGDDIDVFVTKLNASGTSLIYSTYIGGTGGEGGFGIAVDSSGNAYVTGNTLSTDFPTTPGASLRIPRYMSGDAFVAKLNATGSDLVYSTRFGGRGSDHGHIIAVDDEGNAHVAGVSSSLDLPAVAALQQSNASGPTFKSANAGDD